ncbi:MAG: sugar phosphate isomerase/epimerase family protein [Candidatus Thorarchaeota archaeon]|jgi:sugar phosphate isomerase/epimerase
MEIGTFARHLKQVEMGISHSPTFIDLRMDLNYSLNFREVRRMLEDSNIACTLHLPSDPCWRPMDFPREIVPFIDIGAQIGAELVTTHTALSTLFYNDEDIDSFLEWVPLMCDSAKESGVQLAVETLGLYYTELTLLFDRCPDMKIALDIGHGQIMATRNRALDVIQSFYDHIAVVNIHDNHGAQMVSKVRDIRRQREVTHEELLVIARDHDEHLALGDGNIDFHPIFRELKERGYSGKFLMMCRDPERFPTERDKFTQVWLEA